MKLADIVQFYSPISGGVKRYIEGKIEYFSRHPELEHFAIIPSERDGVHRHGSSRIYEVKSWPLPGSHSYRILNHKHKIRAILDREQPDIIEVGDPYRAAWIGLGEARRRGVPIVAFYHSDYPRAFARTVEKYAGRWLAGPTEAVVNRYLLALYNRMDGTVVSTRRFLRTLSELGLNRLHLVPLGTDAEQFRPRDRGDRVRARLGLSPETFLMLFVGRFGREKNIRSLLGLMDHLGPTDRPVHLHLVGDGELLSLVRQTSLAHPSITYEPYCGTREALAELYSAADLFVHGGVLETFGLVSLEAQACGTRVLAVRGSAVEETLDGEDPLILARDPSSEALAEGVREVLKLRETPAIRAARRERIITQFSHQRTYERMLALYRTVLDQHRGANASASHPAATSHGSHTTVSS